MLIDIPKGKRFGNWTVVGRGESSAKSARALWYCLCECGTLSLVSGQALREGCSRSCRSCYLTGEGKPTPRSPAAQARRNARILANVEAGLSYREVAQRYRITRQAVGRIVGRARRRQERVGVVDSSGV